MMKFQKVKWNHVKAENKKAQKANQKAKCQSKTKLMTTSKNIYN